jgi:hypothetical protein
LDIEIADREFAHRPGHRDHRAGNIAADQERNHDAREGHHQQHGHQRQLLLLEPYSGTGNLAILAVAAPRDQVVGQLVDIGEIPFRALDEHHRRSGIAVGHLDGVFRLLEIAGDGRLQFYQAIRFRFTLSGFDRLQGLRDLRGGSGGFLGDGFNFFGIGFIGRGRRQPVQLGVRHPGRGGEFVGQFGLPHRPRDQRIDCGLVRPQRLQGIGADAYQDQDQERRRELNFPGQPYIFDPAEHINPSRRRSPWQYRSQRIKACRCPHTRPCSRPSRNTSASARPSCSPD